MTLFILKHYSQPLTFSSYYRIAGKFRGVQFLWMTSLQSFRGLIIADASDHAHYTLYNCTYFADSHSSAKIGPHENIPLYGNYDLDTGKTLNNYTLTHFSVDWPINHNVEDSTKSGRYNIIVNNNNYNIIIVQLSNKCIWKWHVINQWPTLIKSPGCYTILYPILSKLWVWSTNGGRSPIS
jgi:hypothetical protein